MERHVGSFFVESQPNKKEIAELIIDGNHLEFYSRFHGETVFSRTFIGGDGERNYKVFAKGGVKAGDNKTLENAASHRVFYVLMQNFEFSHGSDISGIKEFSFNIPELINWWGLRTVLYSTHNSEMAAFECHIDPVVIRQENPHVEFYFESKTFNESIVQDDRTSIIVLKEPRIKVSYEKPENIRAVLDDLECLMQLFGLLIGSVSVAADIRLTIEGQDLKSWLYINRDFSYNINTRAILDRPRTYLYVVEDSLPLYYENWRKFFFDDTFSLLRRIYFAANNRDSRFAEDIFVEYIRFLDGYHTRICGDEATKKKIKDALKNSTKEIKKLLFNDNEKPLFEDAIKTAIPEWKYNSSNMEDIAVWIADGYLAKRPLSHRLKELDEKYFLLMQKNAVEIVTNHHNNLTDNLNGKTEQEMINLYYQHLGDTRNYYSHYKMDKSGVLTFNQMIDSINALKAMIISILFTHMGMEEELIRRIIEFDPELKFQTMVLRKDGDRPFEQPMEFLKKQMTNQSIWHKIKEKISSVLKFEKHND